MLLCVPVVLYAHSYVLRELYKLREVTGMNKNIVLCGVGGQGTVLASKLIAAAAMKKGISVMSAETIGMAQRGGSVFSHIRLGEHLHSPMIAKGTADIIIGFEPASLSERTWAGHCQQSRNYACNFYSFRSRLQRKRNDFISKESCQ